MRRHDDQIAVVLCSSLDDPFSGRAFRDMLGTDANTSGLRFFARGLLDFIRFCFDTRAISFQGVGTLAGQFGHIVWR